MIGKRTNIPGVSISVKISRSGTRQRSRIRLPFHLQYISQQLDHIHGLVILNLLRHRRLIAETSTPIPLISRKILIIMGISVADTKNNVCLTPIGYGVELLIIPFIDYRKRIRLLIAHIGVSTGKGRVGSHITLFFEVPQRGVIKLADVIVTFNILTGLHLPKSIQVVDDTTIDDRLICANEKCRRIRIRLIRIYNKHTCCCVPLGIWIDCLPLLRCIRFGPYKLLPGTQDTCINPITIDIQISKYTVLYPLRILLN
ncbi:hypothetical protein HEP75_01693 [Xanthomonas sp. SI]|nr:hypothetical protein HEP75_01693 [Xanthomonas sp. SI]